ncbi:MAG TPA: flagellar basal-body rod protein FlgG [Spirochaetota bacterium]|nr:flagellar basal-body rod protein FlgG [Spirochaetota bacterium]HOM38376.1 flagellar basal-body rod protein FlgG [Spirochaetota bacterium]HPQ48406.1 flagellar basal-body rod protein FlgG [Spirochaetota bacterium]
MMRSLWTAATGMQGQQFLLDTIANNLSNVNTVGFKKNRVDFQDLLYQSLRLAGSPSSLHRQNLSKYPTGIEAGLGVEVGATQKQYTQGSAKQTENELDMMIFGNGFFRVRLPDGRLAYTRDGSFKLDSNGDILTSDGYYLEPRITLPQDYIPGTVNISEEGIVTVKTAANPNEDIEIGQILIYRFINSGGLTNIGKNLAIESQASGPAIEGIPARNGFGFIKQKFLEMSNVNAIQEMVDMIVAQRAYEMDSKAIQTSDNMLGTAVSLKR